MVTTVRFMLGIRMTPQAGVRIICISSTPPDASRTTSLRANSPAEADCLKFYAFHYGNRSSLTHTLTHGVYGKVSLSVRAPCLAEVAKIRGATLAHCKYLYNTFREWARRRVRTVLNVVFLRVE